MSKTKSVETFSHTINIADETQQIPGTNEELARCIPLYEIHTAAYLNYREIPLTLTKQGSRVVFEAPATDATYKALTEYQSNPVIPLLDFVAVLRRLRSRMLDMRDGNDCGRRKHVRNTGIF